MKPRWLLALLLIFPTLALPPGVAAKDHRPVANKQQLHTQGAQNPQQAAAMARRQHPGKVLGVKRKNKHFQVKMLHEGRVRYVSIKAE
jgi:hypothetical protein